MCAAQRGLHAGPTQPAAAVKHLAQRESLALAEVSSWSISFCLADRACRESPVRLLGLETNGGDGMVAKFAGNISALENVLALYASESRQRSLRTDVRILARPEDGMDEALFPKNSIHPLYENREQCLPDDYTNTMKNNQDAIGILETIGLTASLCASDSMLKAASVQLVGKEKIGAAYVTIVIRGEVSAVEAAVAAGREAVGDLGKIVASYVIARPHPDMLALLPG